MGIGGKSGDWTVVGKAYDSLITQADDARDMLGQLEEYNLRDAEIVAEFVRRYYGY